MRWAMMIAMLALAACDVGGVNDVLTPVSQQRAVGNFDIAVSRVMPIAEDKCRASAASHRCDFQIVVDDRPGRAPNAFQSLDDHGRPVLTFTAALVADARNPDEIALIIAHEAAHHIDGHLGQLNRKVAFALGQDDRVPPALGLAHDLDQSETAWSDIQASVHAFELEADALGAQIVMSAGFDPVKGAQIFLRLPEPHAHAAGAHPANADRFRAVRRAKAAAS